MLTAYVHVYICVILDMNGDFEEMCL